MEDTEDTEPWRGLGALEGTEEIRAMEGTGGTRKDWELWRGLRK